MIFYGDHIEEVAPAAMIEGLDRRLQAMAVEQGLARHARLVSAFIDLGRLTQAVADAGLVVAEAACMSALMELARSVLASWDSDFAISTPPPVMPGDLAMPASLNLRLPEGYAFYALYPEAYIAAARRLCLGGPVRVIGIRSIGTSLAALVAVVLGAPPPVTVRPHGYPFDRRVTLEGGDLGPADACYVVVDEGPGLSGSSVVAVVDALASHGVARDRIVLMPGHGGGPGAEAGAHHRATWATTRVEAADAGVVVDRLHGWAETLLGPLDSPLQDVSGGSWRGFRWPDEADWPATGPMRERLKFIARADGSLWLLRFVGLGAEGEVKLARARLLHAQDLVPEPLGLVHGFLVERWCYAVAPVGKPLARIGTYLGHRARLFPQRGGASLDALFDMARANAAEALGPTRAASFDRWRPLLPELTARTLPVAIDGRCQRHKWLALADGRLLKADSHDHARGHDLIGPQDIAWDCAGVAVEFDLSAAEQRKLVAVVAQVAGRAVDAELTAFLTLCYLGFRLGEHALNAAALPGWPAEAARNAAAAAAYADRLDTALRR